MTAPAIVPIPSDRLVPAHLHDTATRDLAEHAAVYAQAIVGEIPVWEAIGRMNALAESARAALGRTL